MRYYFEGMRYYFEGMRYYFEGMRYYFEILFRTIYIFFFNCPFRGSVKQTTSGNAYILYERLAGNKINSLSNYFFLVNNFICSAASFKDISPCLDQETNKIKFKK